MISKDDVKHIAWLARLELSEEEVEKFCQQLGQILEHAAIIQQVDTKKVKPTAHPLPLKNVFRSDEVRPSIPKSEALKNAPRKEKGAFTVPKIT